MLYTQCLVVIGDSLIHSQFKLFASHKIDIWQGIVGNSSKELTSLE